MNFSIVLPSRGENPLIKMLDSFERTTRHKKLIEFLIAIDEGKTDIINQVNKKKYSFSVQFFERPQTEDFTNDYYNWLANRTVGKNIMAFNDDAWMRTNNWDEKALQAIAQYKCTVYMLDFIDTARMKYKHQFPCFPCVSRRAFCSLGWLLFPMVPIYPADKLTHDVYFRANRVIPIRDVLIEHEHLPETDDSKKKMWELFLKKNTYGVSVINIGDEILRLSLVAQSDGPLRLSKLRRIINIIKEK